MANKNKKVDLDRRRFLVGATSITGAIGASAMGIPFVSSMLPSEKAKAAGASVEVDISQVKQETVLTTEWRGQPVWILNRSDKMIKTLEINPKKLGFFYKTNGSTNGC